LGNPAGIGFISETDNIIDLNLKADYRFSDKFSTFVMLNNILNRKYERFTNYPNKGLNVIGGISYTF
jgi:outer membrane cobalamin receptor